MVEGWSLGMYLNSAKWKILNAFDEDKTPKEINCPQVKKATIYAYYQEWKRKQFKDLYRIKTNYNMRISARN